VILHWKEWEYYYQIKHPFTPFSTEVSMKNLLAISYLVLVCEGSIIVALFEDRLDAAEQLAKIIEEFKER
jgi:hypothetical protein